ncbi:hypothetical protein JTF06_08615 [Desemzia sp. RIT804]|uniref:hypothetical protein n=1 Tax=Desemzia sp. RIT 804 TaxID=2810209 RepID=UPI00194E2252|nr:hypothetical protein [Desemzia sp. RIT 804]MBM6614952.1 hypothetical protein [Desemzia sp. RIT 804]
MRVSIDVGEDTAQKLAETEAKLIVAVRREDRLKMLVESLPDAVIYAIGTPKTVTVSEIVLLPTKKGFE